MPHGLLARLQNNLVNAFWKDGESKAFDKEVRSAGGWEERRLNTGCFIKKTRKAFTY